MLSSKSYLFFRKLGIFLLPIILVMLLIEWSLRHIPNDYRKKDIIYSKYAGDFEVLILGSSYALYQFNPIYFEYRAFNGGHVGQSLDIDAAIFCKYESKLKNLKYLILPLSDISFLMKLSDSKEDWRTKDYYLYYHLPNYRFKINYCSELLSFPFSLNRERLISYYIQKREDTKITELGFGTNFRSQYKNDLQKTAQIAVEAHKVPSTAYLNEEKGALNDIIIRCQKKGIKVILVIPPAYTSFRNIVNSNQLNTTITNAEHFAKIYSNVHFLNFFSDSTYEANDFYDANHLNEVGAAKLSKVINNYILNLR